MPQQKDNSGDTPGPYSIPHDLEQRAIKQFDKLVEDGQIIWEPYIAEDAEDSGFKVQYQRAPHLLLKPINPASSKKTSQGKNPFADPDPAFVLAYPSRGHTLILNKFPVYRESLIIHTNEFRLQTEDLDNSDLAACWQALDVLSIGASPAQPDQRQWIMIFNCGVEAGSSQGHKHMQLWPLPPATELGFEIFAGRAQSMTAVTTLSDIPFRHYILRLPKDAQIADVTTAYATLLSKVQQCNEQYGSTAYNVAMTREWLMLVPRRSNGQGYGAGGNTAVVLGLLWINGEDEKLLWKDYGVAAHLSQLGVPNDV